MDFTVEKYKKLLKTLQDLTYTFQSFEEFIQNPQEKSIVLRHDVDLLPKNSLLFAKIQAELGIKGVYYFRAVPESWDEKIIIEIASLGHEIGYHYENLTTCKGDVSMAIKDFEQNLSRLRKLVPVSTICMHGSPLSKFDSKDLWKTKKYQDFDLIGEPYFYVDFSKVLYLTDTGRRWNGEKVSVRDKVNSTTNLNLKSTEDVIRYFENGTDFKQIMFTFHPQRWNDNPYLWTKEFLFQSIKNQIKRFFFVK
ncbi:MAG: hypothetical protein V4622_04685 [Bacteroidota bacterium]